MQRCHLDGTHVECLWLGLGRNPKLPHGRLLLRMLGVWILNLWISNQWVSKHALACHEFSFVRYHSPMLDIWLWTRLLYNYPKYWVLGDWSSQSCQKLSYGWRLVKSKVSNYRKLQVQALNSSSIVKEALYSPPSLVGLSNAIAFHMESLK